MSERDTLIVLDHLSVGYGTRQVVHDINFTFQRGKVVCLLGANGCGKTTLLKTMLGVLPALGGGVTLAGKPLAGWTRRDLARFIGYVPQAHNGIFPFSAEEVVLMGRTARMSWYATPQAHDREIARAALCTLGIEHLQQRNYTQLSGGERQLVLLARALAQEPQFLIMDEPTASLDFGNQIRVLERIRKLKNDGMAILMTTHQPEHAYRVADEIMLLHGGKMLATGTAAQTLTIDNLSLLYDVDHETMADNLAFRKSA
jgi:ABC-type cobalamin/Fe3+-siderophores transport systems, ATPase components